MKTLRDCDLKSKRVLLRLDINSPLDPETKKITSDNRLRKSLPTLTYLRDSGAKTAIIAHQGDTLDYHNLYPLEEHAAILSNLLGQRVPYLDDVCGPAAKEVIAQLEEGQFILLGNLRYLTEEVSTFESVVKLTPQEMTKTYLVRQLAPLFDLYVNDAFSAAHRNCPSMVAFQMVLPSAAGFLLQDEIENLDMLMKEPKRPSVFILGGLKISDAFGMMETVLANGSADKIITSGVTGNLMLIASGVNLGDKTMRFLEERNLLQFLEPAREYLSKYADRIELPRDLAYDQDGLRSEIDVDKLPLETLFLDIGQKTIKVYENIIAQAGTAFVNGPAGVYEDARFQDGTKSIWESLAKSPAYTVVGGGDTVSAAQHFINTDDINYICTAGGAMVRYLSGVAMPLIDAMKATEE